MLQVSLCLCCTQRNSEEEQSYWKETPKVYTSCTAIVNVANTWGCFRTGTK